MFAAAGLTGLTHLDLFGTRITDYGTNSLRGLTALVSLNVSNSRITNGGLHHLKLLKNLRTLAMEPCKVTSSEIKKLQSTAFPNLIVVSASIKSSHWVFLKGFEAYPFTPPPPQPKEERTMDRFSSTVVTFTNIVNQEKIQWETIKTEVLSIYNELCTIRSLLENADEGTDNEDPARWQYLELEKVIHMAEAAILDNGLETACSGGRKPPFKRYACCKDLGLVMTLT
ncbi:hypothetical protein NE237_009385 [Protea cynaroides]|uniref:Uncharacterized protein n=1 Tax=Protea cynaroides TaxID=273540 RepID=A0A9Q0KXQ2_9MAGN|nr:hypothetical protein NE237_009385 [Protea cynaroides]